MSEPRVPPEVVIAELRSYCDEKARFLLTRHIEGEAGLPDMILSSDQKNRFLNLWFCAAMQFGATKKDDPTQRICRAAIANAGLRDPDFLKETSLVANFVQRSQGVEDRGREIFNSLLDNAFGTGLFDHNKVTPAWPSAELGACVRYATHLATTHKFR